MPSPNKINADFKIIKDSFMEKHITVGIDPNTSVLEYLDSIGFTQILENGRVLKERHLTIKEDKDERSIQKHVGNTGAGSGGT